MGLGVNGGCGPFFNGGDKIRRHVEMAIGGREHSHQLGSYRNIDLGLPSTKNEMAKQSNGAPQACYKKWSLLS